MSDQEKRGLLFCHFIEPTHVGTGEGLGRVDRPVFRESTTGFPTIMGSTLKGAMKSSLPEEDWDPASVAAAFGADGENGNKGCILWGDLKLLFLPARSLAGTFAWTTSPLALARLERSLSLAGGQQARAGLQALQDLLQMQPPASGTAIGTSNVLRVNDGPIIVEGFVLQPSADADGKLAKLAEWLVSILFPDEKEGAYWRSFLSDRVLLLAEDAFTHLCRESLPVDANIRIDPETGVTEDGSLRYTEFLPAETVMYSPLAILPSLRRADDEGREFALESWKSLPTVLQFGAEESKGKGVSRLCYLGEPSTGN